MTSGYQAFSRPAGGKAADCRTIPALHAKLRFAADPLLGEGDSGWHAPMHLAEGMASFPVRMPSLRIRCCRVPRGMPSCAAAPLRRSGRISCRLCRRAPFRSGGVHFPPEWAVPRPSQRGVGYSSCRPAPWASVRGTRDYAGARFRAQSFRSRLHAENAGESG